VTRETSEAAGVELEKLMNRDWRQVELFVLYIDGMRFGSLHTLSAAGVDAHGSAPL